jgi:hypothetical protein
MADETVHGRISTAISFQGSGGGGDDYQLLAS